MRYYASFLLLFYICCLSVPAQDKASMPVVANKQILKNNFDYKSFEEILLILINEERASAKVDLLVNKQVLKRAAYDQSSFMSEFNLMEQDDPGERALLYGGTRKVEEILAKASITKGTDKLTYLQVAQSVLDKWLSTPKTKTFLLKPEYYYTGISATLSEDGKKIFVACMYGNDASFSHNLSESDKRYIGEKTYGLLDYHPKICKKTEKVDDIHLWANGLYVDKGIIYLEHPDGKAMKRLLKDPEDGFAVDIVQRAQFSCDSINVIDYKRPYKGIMLKRVFAPELLSSNMVAESKTNRFVVALGMLPPLLDSIYELNLVVIQQRHICEDLKKAYIEIAPTRHFYKGSYAYYNDPEHPDEELPAYASTNREFQKRMCDRSKNSWYKNDHNSYDCMLSTFMLSGVNSIVEYNNLIIETERLLKTRAIPARMLRQLQIEASVKTLQLKVITKHEREELLKYLQEKDYLDENMNNTYAIAQLMINNQEFETALSILDPHVTKPNFDEELLFSHITLSSLTQNRILSNLFVAELEMAQKRNLERYCALFNEHFSFQLYENKKIKEAVCDVCPSLIIEESNESLQTE